MKRDTKIFLAQLIGAMLFSVTVMGVACYYNAQPEPKSAYYPYVTIDRGEIARLQPAAMAEAAYQINEEIGRRFKP